MAALSDAAGLRLADLRDLRATDLNPMLSEEGIAWRTLLSWDFSASAELVRRFVNIQALNGYALIAAGKIAGYAYYVVEDRKALIGDLFLVREFSSAENEDRLLGAVLKALLNTRSVHRVEAQLLMMRGAFDRPLPFGNYLTVQPRVFMLADTSDVERLPPHSSAANYRFEPWAEERHEESAKLISDAYDGHVDSTINDQYRSITGARRFLTNIVQYPGCGAFFDNGSIAALDGDRVVGLCLSSLVASDVGHITQICVAPELQGTGVGYELLRRSLLTFVRHGCEKVSLTVTASNVRAIQLYQRTGFRGIRRFGSFVWEGF